MKKLLLSLVGSMLIIGFVRAYNTNPVDISDLFYGGTPLVDDAYSKLLNEYDDSRGYSDSHRITVECQNNSSISIVSPIVEDNYFDKVRYYRLIISPYTVNKIKNSGSSLDISKFTVKKITVDDNAEALRFDVPFSEIDEETNYYAFIVPIDMYDTVGTPTGEIYLSSSNNLCISTIKTITLKPGLNSFSTPAVVESISFSNGGDNISFAKMVNGKWTPVTFTDSNVKSVIRPLDGFIVRNSNSEDITMTIVYDTDIDINDALLQKQLDAGWNFLGVTKTFNPFGTVANAVVKDIIDFTLGNSNQIDLSKLRDATSFMLGKAYGVFVNNSNGIYGGRNNNGNGENNDGEDLTLVQDDENRLNILLVAYGGEYWEGRNLISDSVMVVSWDLDTNNVTLTSLPNIKVSASTARELANITKSRVSQTLGLDIHHYATMDFAAFKDVIDILGGIDIYVDKTIKDTQFPNDLGFNNGSIQYHRDATRGYAPFNISAGQHRLNGETTLKYVRSINTESDSDRAYRQQKVLQAIMEKVAEGFDISQLYDLYNVYDEKIVTNISLFDALWIVRHLDEIQNISHESLSVCYDPIIKLACSIGSDSCPEYCKLDAELTNNMTRTVEFNSNESQRKLVFNGTYTVNNTNINRIKGYMSGINNLTGVDITYYVIINGEEYDISFGPENKILLLDSEAFFGEPVRIKVEAEVVAYGFTGELNNIKLYLIGIDENRNEIPEAGAELAPIKIVDNDAFTIKPTETPDTVLLKAENSTLAMFNVKPANGDTFDLNNITLRTRNGLSCDDIELRVNGTEYECYNAGNGTDLLYEIDRVVGSTGATFNIEMNGAHEGSYMIGIMSINDRYNYEDGNNTPTPWKIFTKRFESVLVYLTSENDMGTYTEYTLGVDKYNSNSNDTVRNLKLFTGYDSNYEECEGQLTINGLDDEIEDNDEFSINNSSNDMMINCIEYDVIPASGTRRTVSINKLGYPDFFKINGITSRRVFARDGVSNLCGNGRVDEGENCSNCPADVGECPAYCGNGRIDEGETCLNCPEDLGDICTTNSCNSVDDLEFSHTLNNGVITLNWTPNREVYINVKEKDSIDEIYGSEHGIPENKVSSPYVFDIFDSSGQPNYYEFQAYESYEECDHYKNYIVDATNICNGVDNLNIQHQIQDGEIILNWDPNVKLDIATIVPPHVYTENYGYTFETAENGTFSQNIGFITGDYTFILTNNFFCENKRLYTVTVNNICGDGKIDEGENCSNCPEDMGNLCV